MLSWNFPKIDDCESFTCEELIDKLKEETQECIEALREYDNSDNFDDRLSFISETLDVVHVCETILRSYGVEYAELQEGVTYVTLKNKLRGYYEKDTRTAIERNSVQRR